MDLSKYREIEALYEDVELKQYDKMKRYSDNVEALYGEKPYKTDKN
jgi:hypothetical protein